MLLFKFRSQNRIYEVDSGFKSSNVIIQMLKKAIILLLELVLNHLMLLFKLGAISNFISTNMF